MIKHQNNGQCLKCVHIRNQYEFFYVPLWAWFVDFQRTHPEAHISCAGRGMVDQEAAYQRKATRARWRYSSHNYGAALDLFVITPGESNIYPVAWFNQVLSPELPAWINWYGRKGSPFFELPHVEISDWRDLVASGDLQLVE